jgi:acyl-CoA thioesterase FadM
MKDHQIQVQYSETDQMGVVMEVHPLFWDGNGKVLRNKGFRIKYGRKWHCFNSFYEYQL